MRSVSLLTSSFLLLFLISSCHKNEPCTTCPPGGPDTTSHSFNFTQFTFGGNAGSSSFKDVAIINDSLAYAVGAVYLTDSLGNPDPNAYNVAVWNGREWTLRKITVSFRGDFITPPLEGIFAFSPIDIWLVGSLPIHGDGQNWTMFDVRSVPGLDSESVSKAWGTSSSSMYFVGRIGSMIFYDGSTWTKLESGTTLDINDIWGATDASTAQTTVLAVGSERFQEVDKKVLRIDGTTVTALPDSGLPWSISGVWFAPGQHYYVVGDGIYQKTSLSDNLWSGHALEITPYYSWMIRGNAANDLFVVGAYGDVVHYNGSTWQSFQNIVPLTDGSYESVAMKGDLVMAVGLDNPRAVIAIGRRVR